MIKELFAPYSGRSLRWDQVPLYLPLRVLEGAVTIVLFGVEELNDRFGIGTPTEVTPKLVSTLYRIRRDLSEVTEEPLAKRYYEGDFSVFELGKEK
jgi:hypothetical protein